MSITHAEETQVREILQEAASVISAGFDEIAKRPSPSAHQVELYDLVHAHAAIEVATGFCDFAKHGPVEAAQVSLFATEAIRSLLAICVGRSWVSAEQAAALNDFVGKFGTAEHQVSLADDLGSPHLSEDFEMVAETFERFAGDKIEPIAEHIHRHDEDVPDELIAGIAELGAFGLSVPEAYGGTATGSSDDMLAMVIATESLSTASLAIGGSLLTRPEILIRAIELGGTEAQKQKWLPQIAEGEVLGAVAVTEPDYGSDVAALRCSATRDGNEWVINGVKTWCTWAGRADVLFLLARTGPGEGHRGLSLFIVEKPRTMGHAFKYTQDTGGTIEGTAIPTIGYRGLHSFEVSFDEWRVPHECLVGGDEQLGRGFYLQMAGFEGGRLQTAARAVGLMRRAYQEAHSYANERQIFGQALADFQLTKAKLGKMVAITQACRQYSYRVASMINEAGGGLEASLIKAYACKAVEWIAREAMQIHGGFGYAEEYTVSRVFVDARVLSIFEGADETLSLKVIARRLLAERREN